MPNQVAVIVAENQFKNWICPMGSLGKSIQSKNGFFNQIVFQNVWGLLSIKKTRTTLLHPQSYEMVKKVAPLKTFPRMTVNKSQSN